MGHDLNYSQQIPMILFKNKPISRKNQIFSQMIDYKKTIQRNAFSKG